MKVLHLLASPFLTGPAETVIELALAQRALGVDVGVAIDRLRTTASSEELLGPRVDELRLRPSWCELELSVKSAPLAMWRDLRALHRSRVDVVHSHFSHDHALARLGRPRGARLVRSIHAPRSITWATPKADGYTVPMDSLARALLGQRVLVLPAFVAARFAPSRNQAALRGDLGLSTGPLVGMVSTFQTSRRHDLALAAFRMLLQRHPEATLVLIGDGPLESSVKEAAADLGERVRFLGYHAGESFVRRLQALDEVWVLGLGNDWSARAAAQARACGVRVVAVDEGALSTYADVVVTASAEAVASASLGETRVTRAVEAPSAIAARVLRFYEGLGAA